MEIRYTSKFDREIRRIPITIQHLTHEKIELFRINPFDPALKTHKLKGKFENFWSFSITHRFRIVFRFLGGEIVHFHSIGDHSVYD